MLGPSVLNRVNSEAGSTSNIFLTGFTQKVSEKLAVTERHAATLNLSIKELRLDSITRRTEAAVEKLSTNRPITEENRGLLLRWANILREGYVASADPDNTEMTHNVTLARSGVLNDCPHTLIEHNSRYPGYGVQQYGYQALQSSQSGRLGRFLTAEQRAAITALENSSETPLTVEQRTILYRLLKDKSVVMLGLGPYSWKQSVSYGNIYVQQQQIIYLASKHMNGAISRIFGVSEVDAQRLREKYSSLEEAMFEENAEVKALQLELAEVQRAVEGTKRV